MNATCTDSTVPIDASFLQSGRGLVSEPRFSEIHTGARIPNWITRWRPGVPLTTLEEDWRDGHHNEDKPAQFEDTLDFHFDRGPREQMVRAHGWVTRRTGGRSFNKVGYYTRKPSMREFISARVDINKTPQANGYDCGHVIADSLGGPPANPANFFPQRPRANRAGSTYFEAEKFARDVSDTGIPQCSSTTKNIYVSLSLRCLDSCP